MNEVKTSIQNVEGNTMMSRRMSATEMRNSTNCDPQKFDDDIENVTY